MTPHQEALLQNAHDFGVTTDLGSDIYIGQHFDPDRPGDFMWWHPCTTGSGLMGIDVTSGRLHSLVSREPLHIEASLICPECGCHGWIRDGRWVEA